MQGLKSFIPTARKIEYLNQLLQVGFHTIDAGSFVSPRAVPQMADTREVLSEVSKGDGGTKLLVIVANERGARDAARVDSVDFVGFPLSVSETFQKLNTNKSIVDALNELEAIDTIVKGSGKQTVVYLSMAFGNPYGDAYDKDLVRRFVDILVTMGFEIISVADTVGAASPGWVGDLLSSLVTEWPQIEFGAHLHGTPSLASALVDAALGSGVKRMDGALLGFGGCPMAKDDLVGNIGTEVIVDRMSRLGMPAGIDRLAFDRALRMASEIFPRIENITPGN